VHTLVLLWNLVTSMRLRMLSFLDARPRSTGAACGHARVDFKQASRMDTHRRCLSGQTSTNHVANLRHYQAFATTYYLMTQRGADAQ